MIKQAIALGMALSLIACEGNIHGEMSGKYETKSSSRVTVKVNDKVVKDTYSENKNSGGFENEFNIIIGEEDTIIDPNNLPALNPKIACNQVLSDTQVEQLKTAINQVFSDKTRLLTAKVAINDWCLTSNQLRDVLALFTMDKYRLDLAKFGYGHITDRINYHRVKDALSFDDTKEKLDAYINTL